VQISLAAPERINMEGTITVLFTKHYSTLRCVQPTNTTLRRAAYKHYAAGQRGVPARVKVCTIRKGKVPFLITVCLQSLHSLFITHTIAMTGMWWRHLHFCYRQLSLAAFATLHKCFKELTPFRGFYCVLEMWDQGPTCKISYRLDQPCQPLYK
jgi:hypothetical protein